MNATIGRTYVWITPEGKAEATAERQKGVAAFQCQRDARKAEAIALHDSGLTVEQIEAELGRDKRTIKSYLQDGR